MQIFSIDPGNIKSGFVRIIDGNIVEADTTPNNELMGVVLANKGRSDLVVVYEDIKPYSVRMGQQTVDTIKFIGQLEYRLMDAEIINKAIPRWEVKKWVYDNHPDICEERIMAKIVKKELKGKGGEDRKSSFVFVDDRIIVTVMKKIWHIPTPKPGKRSLYGLSNHSWQALSVATFYMAAKKV